MRSVRTSRLAAPLVAAALAVAFTVVARGVQVREHDSAWAAPAEVAAKTNPLATKPAAEAGARKLFAQKCAACHGEEGRGTPKAPDLTLPPVQAEADGTLFWKISTGNTRKGMPSFSFLPEAQRWQLVLRLRTLANGSHP